MKKIKNLTTAGKMVVAGILVLVLALGTFAAGAFIKVDPSDPNSESVTSSLLGLITSSGGDTVSAEELTENDVAEMIQLIERQPNIDSKDVENFLTAYFQKYGYKKMKVKRLDGSVQDMWVVPLADDCRWVNDEARATWGMEAKLTDHVINDAIARPFNLSQEQRIKILSLDINQTASMSSQELEGLRDQLFKAYLELPWLFEADVRLICDQHIGQVETFGAHYHAGQDFIAKCDAARAEGKGLRIWYTDTEQNVAFTLPEYHLYVAAFMKMLSSCEVEVSKLVSGPGQHYGLMTADYTDMRQAAAADYTEDLPSLTFLFKMKDGKVALRFGANLVDKRPEVLNYMVMQKQEAVASTPIKASGKKSSSGGGGSTPSGGSTPGGGGGDTPQNKERKSLLPDLPNAVTDHTSSNTGPGPHEADEGNSPSATVDGAGGHAGNTANTDGGNPANYEQGGAADATDGGNTPDTNNVENQVGEGEGRGNNDYESGGANNGVSQETQNIVIPVFD